MRDDRTMNWLKRLGQSRLVDIAVLAIALVHVVGVAQILPERWSELDFNSHYVGSRMILEGQNPFTTSLAPMSARYGLTFHPERVPTALYPPGFFVMFAPWALLPPRLAFAGWVVLELICLAAILWLTRRLLNGRLSKRGWRLACLGTLASLPVLYHFCFSNVELLLAAVVLAAYAWHRAGRHGAACVAVCVAGLIKLYPFALLPWFVWRSGDDMRWRMRCGLLSLGTVIAGVLVTGPGLWLDFFQHSTAVAAADQIGRTNQFGLPSFVVNLGYAVYDYHPPTQAARAVWAVGSVAWVAVIALSYAICWGRGGDREMEFCLLSTAMLAATLSAHGQYFVYLIFPMTVAAGRLANNPTLSGIVFFALLLALLNSIRPLGGPFFDRAVFLKILANYLPLYAVIALGVFFGRETRAAGHVQRAGGTSRARLL
jgi:hypothetical protein